MRGTKVATGTRGGRIFSLLIFWHWYITLWFQRRQRRVRRLLKLGGRVESHPLDHHLLLRVHQGPPARAVYPADERTMVLLTQLPPDLTMRFRFSGFALKAPWTSAEDYLSPRRPIPRALLSIEQQYLVPVVCNYSFISSSNMNLQTIYSRFNDLTDVRKLNNSTSDVNVPTRQSWSRLPDFRLKLTREALHCFSVS